MDEGNREAALAAMQSALTGKPSRKEPQGIGAVAADAFADLERDEVHVEFVMMHESHVAELRGDPNLGLGPTEETLWGAQIVESKDMPPRMIVTCGFEDNAEENRDEPRTALVSW